MHLGLLATALKIIPLISLILQPRFSSCISHLGLLCPFSFLLFSRILPVLMVILELYFLMPSWLRKFWQKFMSSNYQELSWDIIKRAWSTSNKVLNVYTYIKLTLGSSDIRSPAWPVPLNWILSWWGTSLFMISLLRRCFIFLHSNFTRQLKTDINNSVKNSQKYDIFLM